MEELHPVVALLLGAGVDLHHLWLIRARRDEEQTALLVGHLAHNQPLQGDHRRPLVLQGPRMGGEGRGERQREEREREREGGRERERGGERADTVGDRK